MNLLELQARHTFPHSTASGRELPGGVRDLQEAAGVAGVGCGMSSIEEHEKKAPRQHVATFEAIERAV